MVKFDRGNYDLGSPPGEVPLHSRIEGIFFCLVFTAFTLVLWHCHKVHFAVFREQYREIVGKTTNLSFTKHMHETMAPRAHQEGLANVDLDV